MGHPGGVLVDVQFSSAHNDWPRLRDAVLQAEAEGHDTTWVFDHFDGAMLRGDRPLLECFTLLGAMAAATTTIGLGTLVVNVANRHRAVTAAAASSVQRISDGRLHLGIGAGGGPDSPWAREHRERGIALEPDLSRRYQAVVLQIEALREVEPMPVIVGVNSTALARIAGRFADGVNVGLLHPSAADFIAAAREEAGDHPFEVSAWCSADYVEGHQVAEAMQVDRLVLTRLEALGD